MYLLNCLPIKTLQQPSPYFALYGVHPSYSQLRVFGCRCYPNLSSIAPHKLSPRSTFCVFFGYSAEHKGYRCLDLSTDRLIVSRHVTFDESSFPFAERSSVPANLDFLNEFEASVLPIRPRSSSVCAGSDDPLAGGSNLELRSVPATSTNDVSWAPFHPPRAAVLSPSASSTAAPVLSPRMTHAATTTPALTSGPDDTNGTTSPAHTHEYGPQFHAYEASRSKSYASVTYIIAGDPSLLRSMGNWQVAVGADMPFPSSMAPLCS